MSHHLDQQVDLNALSEQIKLWGEELGFQKTGITDTSLSDAEKHLSNWLEKQFHGEMGFMEKHGLKRTRPEQLIPGTTRVITVRIDYLPESIETSLAHQNDKANAFISRYALGRDYHKLLRKKLQKLASMIEEATGSSNYRVFTDSAPVMEKALAEKAGLGWIGKHTNLIDKKSSSWFFLGEIYTDLPLPLDKPATNHCGDCTACLDCCPTQAIVAPYQVDARRCISYLTIELKGTIPVDLRKPIGNRIYGCDDCQQVCPWNRFARITKEIDFTPRHQLDSATLAELFSWDEETFLKKTEGSAIRRIGYVRWLRNLAVALGNSDTSSEVKKALKHRLTDQSEIVREHTRWALEQHT